MFQVDEMIVYGKHEVCKVVAKGKIEMPMIDKNKEYYTLLPCKEKASVVYAPVENNKTVMRYVLTPEEVNSLLKEVPALEEIWVGNEREREREREREACYKEILGMCDCRELSFVLGKTKDEILKEICWE